MDLKKLKEELLGLYQVRKTDAQKCAFIDWATDYARQSEIPVTVEESGGYICSRNIVFGDVDKARVILTAHYDTCARMLMPNFSTPGCLPLFVIEQTVLTLLIVLGGIFTGNAVSAILPAELHALAAGMVSWSAGFAGAALVLLLMLAGPANPHTANDNTSGVLLVLLAMRRFKEKPGIAYVLFDNEEKGLFGSQAFIKAHPQAARRCLINFDCVGDGDTLLYTGMKRAMVMPQAKRLIAAMEEIAPKHGMKTVSGEFPKWIYPSDQMLFPRGTAFAALKGSRVLYMDRIHTAQDTVLEERNIRCLLDVLERSVS
ncbi:MAG: M28 family peptidase [Clostridia bacterium]|nr:M28 family peptidase [Clostridia bacterium]